MLGKLMNLCNISAMKQASFNIIASLSKGRMFSIAVQFLDSSNIEITNSQVHTVSIKYGSKTCVYVS